MKGETVRELTHHLSGVAMAEHTINMMVLHRRALEIYWDSFELQFQCAGCLEDVVIGVVDGRTQVVDLVEVDREARAL